MKRCATALVNIGPQLPPRARQTKSTRRVGWLAHPWHPVRLRRQVSWVARTSSAHGASGAIDGGQACRGFRNGPSPPDDRTLPTGPTTLGTRPQSNRTGGGATPEAQHTSRRGRQPFPLPYALPESHGSNRLSPRHIASEHAWLSADRRPTRARGRASPFPNASPYSKSHYGAHVRTTTARDHGVWDVAPAQVYPLDKHISPPQCHRHGTIASRKTGRDGLFPA